MRNSSFRNSSAKSSTNQISEPGGQVGQTINTHYCTAALNHLLQAPPKKSNWEVIEHYNPGNALTGAPSGQTKVSTRLAVSELDNAVQDSPDDDSDDDEDEVESILLDHTHEWWNMWALFRRVFRSHRFKVCQANLL